MQRADFHTHSSLSDGTDAPRDLVDLAALAGVSTLAITDHESTEAYPQAETRARDLGVRLIPGVELSARSAAGMVHVLGYFVDGDSPRLRERLRRIRRDRLARNERTTAALVQRGFAVDLDSISALVRLPSDQLGARHFKKWLLVKEGLQPAVAAGYVEGAGEGDAHKPSLDECIGLVMGAGGVAAVAHPILAKDWQELVASACAAGAAAIETVHPKHSADDIARLRATAARMNLIAIGGSDYHGTRKPGRRLGQPSEPELTPMLADLLERRRP